MGFKRKYSWKQSLKRENVKSQYILDNFKNVLMEILPRDFTQDCMNLFYISGLKSIVPAKWIT